MKAFKVTVYETTRRETDYIIEADNAKEAEEMLNEQEHHHDLREYYDIPHHWIREIIPGQMTP